MTTKLFSPRSLDELRHRLLGGPPFMELAHSFIAAAVKEAAREETIDSRGFEDYYKAALLALTEENATVIAEKAESPIEKTFLNSLLLTFIKNDGLGLIVHQTIKDTAQEVSEFRKILANWKEFWDWFKKNKPANSIEEFLDAEVQRGRMDAEERLTYTEMIFKYGYIPMDDSIHMSLQPPFPNVRINGRAIRPDMYFWIPSKPHINIVVECDGFHYHSDRDRFKSDRQRDRALKSLGYDVFRFSGSEIFNDPINAPFELATYLWNCAEA